VAEAERLAHRYSLVVQRAAQKVERDASAASAAEEAVAAAVAKQRQQDEALAAKRAIAEAQAARLQREQTEAAAAAAAEAHGAAHGAALDAAWQHVSDFARSSDRGAVGAFGTFDADGSGTLETAEFRRALEASGALELVLTDEVRKRGRGGLRVSG
jgi:hypothetical protein